MATWKKVLVSGSAIEVANITASNVPAGTGGDFLIIDSEGKISKTGSAGSGGIFVDQGTYYNTENTLQISGSTLQTAPTTTSVTASQGAARYAFIVSESAHFYNHNVGYPTSNAWGSNLEGSYFNNFDANTDVSEILRFVAGLLSSSAASPSPNTRRIDSFAAAEFNKTLVTLGDPGLPAGNIPIGYTDPHIQYIINRGFTSTGRQLYELISDPKIKSNNYYITHSSFTDDSTSVSSDGGADSQLVGLGSLNSPGVTVSLNTYVKNNNSGTSYQDAGLAFTSSIHLFTNSTPNSTNNGIKLNTIQTVNPTVIPAVYMDGKITSISRNNNSPLLFNSDGNNPYGINSASISSSGHYQTNHIYNVYSGSQTSNPFFFSGINPTNTKTVFYIPVGQTGHADGDVFGTLLSQLSTDISFSDDLITSGSFTSRSLSGAPYLNGATWYYSVSASNAFYPLYSNDATITSETLAISDLSLSNNENGTSITVSDFSTSGFTATTQNPTTGVITSVGTVWHSGTDQNGSVPNINSVIHLKKTETLNFGGTFNGTDTNTVLINAQSDEIDPSFTVQHITTTGVEGSTNKVLSHLPHIAGHFGQPVSSGSMLLFGSANGQDPGTNGQEKFLGEKYRRTIGSSTVLTTAFDSGSRLKLGSGGDLQVKPGYLVNPESSTYGYWYPADATSYYKWYLREFDMGNTGGNRTTLTVNLGPDGVTPNGMTTFDQTIDNSIAIGLIFERQIPGTSTDTRTKVFDIAKLNSNYINDNISAGTAQFNPFSDSIDFRGNFVTGTSVSSGTYTLLLNNGIFQVIDNTYSKVWALVRYKGNPTNALQNITITAS